MLNAIKHRLAFAFLYPEELIELVDLCTDIFTGLKAHHDELAILRLYKTVRRGPVLLRYLFYAVDVALLHPILDLVGRAWPAPVTLCDLNVVCYPNRGFSGSFLLLVMALWAIGAQRPIPLQLAWAGGIN